MIHAYIFDFDGTIIDSIPLWKKLDEEYLTKHGLVTPEDLHHAIEGLGFLDTAIYFKKRFQLTDSVDDIIQEWSHMIVDLYLSQPLKADALDFINRTNKPIAISSSSSKELILQVLEKNNLTDKIQDIVTSDEVGKSKPHPLVYLETAKRLKIDPASIVVFEDTLAGVQGTKNAGMISCAVYERHNKQWDKTKALSDCFIHSFNEWESVSETLYFD